MNARGSDAVATLRWGLGRYAWLFLLYAVGLAALLPAVASRAQDSYDAEALVVAQRLDMDLVALPRYGEAVFDNGAVARAVAAQFPDDSDIEDVVPARVSLVAEQDSIVLRVLGHDSAPATAADLANTAAAAFLTELNSPGEGVGTFTIQSAAVPPSEPTDPLPRLRFLIPVGLIAGGALGLAAVALVLVSRRPVLEPADAEQATGVPVLGSLTLPRTRSGEMPSASDVVGVVPFTRRLLGLGTDAVVLVSTPRSADARRQLAVATASVLARVCDLRFVAPERMRLAAALLTGAAGSGAATSDAPAAGTAVVATPRMLVGRRPPLLLVDSTDPQDLLGAADVDSTDPMDMLVTAESVTTVLVVPRGMSLRALRVASEEYLGGGPCGLVIVRRVRRRAEHTVSPDEHRPVATDGDARRRRGRAEPGAEPSTSPAVAVER